MAVTHNTQPSATPQPRVPLACPVCGTQFLAAAAEIRRRGRRFCSRRCWHKARPKTPLADRLRAKTVQTESGCLVWTGNTNEKGYGLIGDGHGGTVSTHRVAWTLANGPIPTGAHILHRCDNPPCVNPAHLFLGDNIINQRDCSAKGRKNICRGEKHWKAILTEADVRAARARYAAGGISIREVAAAFGVHKSTMQRALSRRGWQYVT